mmetsp:Transcript_67127/g.106278  ORF Transcript_67127/g.106278 Transcript_67127/m.106278 type:complete len:258 (-) Transcript_67127:437-1210(-)
MGPLMVAATHLVTESAYFRIRDTISPARICNATVKTVLEAKPSKKSETLNNLLGFFTARTKTPHVAHMAYKVAFWTLMSRPIVRFKANSLTTVADALLKVMANTQRILHDQVVAPTRFPTMPTKMMLMPAVRIKPNSTLKKQRQNMNVHKMRVSLKTPKAAMSFLPIASNNSKFCAAKSMPGNDNNQASLFKNSVTLMSFKSAVPEQWFHARRIKEDASLHASTNITQHAGSKAYDPGVSCRRRDAIDKSIETESAT